MTKDWTTEQATWLHAKSEDKWDPQSTDFLDQGGTFTEENGAEVLYAAPETWEDFDVTAIVKHFLNNPNENFGFLSIDDEANGHTQRLYASSDYADDQTLRPKLAIEYETAITWFPQTGLRDKINLNITNATVSFTLPFNNCLTTISNAKGQRILSFEGNTGDKYQVPLHNLGTGLHFLTIKHENRSETVKFFVVK